MKSPIQLMPVLDLKLTFVELLQASRERKDAKMVLLCVSAIEYLKDAQRWHYTEGNTLPDELSGVELRKYVDTQLEVIA